MNADVKHFCGVPGRGPPNAEQRGKESSGKPPDPDREHHRKRTTMSQAKQETTKTDNKNETLPWQNMTVTGALRKENEADTKKVSQRRLHRKPRQERLRRRTFLHTAGAVPSPCQALAWFGKGPASHLAMATAVHHRRPDPNGDPDRTAHPRVTGACCDGPGTGQ